MKTTSQADSTLLIEPEQAVRTRSRTAVPYQQQRNTPSISLAQPVAKHRLPELTTFRALGRQVFGAESNREYIKEALMFASIAFVAAWPIAVAINEFFTMEIGPVPGGPW